MTRCQWVDESKPDYVAYHDDEWGVPVYDDQRFFEFIVLESAQAGLNWYTILRRREGYRHAFAQFDPHKVAQFDEAKIDQLVQDPGIIRHRGKIAAAVNNARCFLEIQQEFGSFSRFIWAYVDDVPLVRSEATTVPATTPLSDRIAKDLKKRGFKFIGSTIVYAFMQATGLVNDHDLDCCCRRV
ncbi:DNA-3-methyladenine glycosylase I [Vibrio sp. SM6]|uniref:DNA-3-methyladenine glycosylase I n=1 Tax=Vibrio agarilyticus TaxID=2726741 RepID=A0A7X8YF92_9VIBR|nr:DNA-3-methyladenine glycosylase I [Vibrio agarilyticus]NLS11409.1 DNA-3-methyladenine glycosylase I [Vibrio agarilyticus]